MKMVGMLHILILQYLITKTKKILKSYPGFEYFLQVVEKPPVKKAEGFCLLVVDKV